MFPQRADRRDASRRASLIPRGGARGWSLLGGPRSSGLLDGGADPISDRDQEMESRKGWPAQARNRRALEAAMKGAAPAIRLPSGTPRWGPAGPEGAARRGACSAQAARLAPLPRRESWIRRRAAATRRPDGKRLVGGRRPDGEGSHTLRSVIIKSLAAAAVDEVPKTTPERRARKPSA